LKEIRPGKAAGLKTRRGYAEVVNSVVLVGRLTADPELQKVNAQNGEVSVCRFTVAVDRPGNGDQADFIDCVAWRETAENLVKFKKKGDPVAVEGRLQIDSYDDSQGVRRKAARVIARRVTFLPTGRKVEEPPLPEPPDWAAGGSPDLPDEELPF
jgi:single-strand DNA-binding protein